LKLRWLSAVAFRAGVIVQAATSLRHSCRAVIRCVNAGLDPASISRRTLATARRGNCETGFSDFAHFSSADIGRPGVMSNSDIGQADIGRMENRMPPLKMAGLKALIAAAWVAGGIAGAPGPAAAQTFEKLFPFLAPSSQPAAPAPGSAGGTAEWSGQSGSSGHPLMTAEAITAAAANFSTCLEGLWPDAARRGVSRATFDTHVSGLRPTCASWT
jgi:hypothetical protein